MSNSVFFSVSDSFSTANFRSNSFSSANFLSQHFLNSHWKNYIYSGSLSCASLNSFSENFTYSGSFLSIPFSCWENFNYLGSFPSIPLNSCWENSNYSGSSPRTSMKSCWEDSSYRGKNLTYSGSFLSIPFNCWENFNYLGSFPSIPLNSCWENSNYSGSSPRTSMKSCWEDSSYRGKNLHPLFAKTLETFQYSFGCWEHFRPAFLLLYGQCCVELLCYVAVVYADYNYFQVSNDFQTHLLFQWGQKSNCSWEQQCFQPKLMIQIMSKSKKPHF